MEHLQSGLWSLLFQMKRVSRTPSGWRVPLQRAMAHPGNSRLLYITSVPSFFAESIDDITTLVSVRSEDFVVNLPPVVLFALVVWLPYVEVVYPC